MAITIPRSPGVRASLPGATGLPQADVAAAGRAGEALARAASGARGELQRRQAEQDRSDSLAAARALAESRAELTRQLSEAEEAAPEGAPDFADGFEDRILAARAARVAALPERVREAFNLRFDELSFDLLDRARRFQAAQGAKKRARDLDGAVASNLNTIRSDPDQFETALADSEAALAASGLSAEDQAAVRVELRDRAARMRLEALNESDPERAKAELESGEFDGFLKPETKNALTNNNQVELRRRAAERARLDAGRRRELGRRVADHLTSLERSGQGLEGIEQEAAGLLEPDELAAFQAAEARAKQTFGALEELRFVPPADMAEIVEGQRPAPGAEGFAEDVKVFDRVQKGAADLLRARNGDPAGFARQAPEVANAFAQARESGDAGDFQAALSRRLELQETMGVQPSQRRTLADGEAKTIAQDMEGRPGQQRAALLEELRGKYGDHFAGAFRDLVAAGLDERSQVLALVDGDPLAAQQLAQVIDLGPAELRKGLDGAVVRDAELAVADALDPFLEAFAAGDFTGTTVIQANGLLSAMQDWAVFHLRQGKDAGTAAQLAAGQVLGRFEVLDGGRFQAFVPLAVERKPVDVAKVETLAETSLTREALESFGLAPLGDPQSPEFLNLERVLSTVENSGFWVTNAAGTGLLLLYAPELPIPVQKDDGGFVEIDFLEASALPIAVTRRAGVTGLQDAGARAAAESARAARAAELETLRQRVEP